ncbi:putative DJ-1 family protein [Tritrichomonas foetus]|uniref:DJ-1 family protein n=1 Tax=Tritrichomonas foetus TaxID=1144522 RepID=A0A1J4KLP2_9EUKA|nr:putative DJ-1 family protein [Tritrichomonas foetus]|eukprot:OHT10716.1 putative DJ-1 family protein [Tritrichomonas foetus]
MVKAVVLLAPGFEPLEASAPIDVLRRAGVEVVLAAVGSATLYVEGAHGITIHCDKKFDEIANSLFDAIVCPGGLPGASNLAQDVKVVAALKSHFKANKVVAAICASPGLVLSEACKLTKGKKACAYPGFDDKITENGGTKVEDKVCIDGKLVTSRGPGTAILFGLGIVEVLVSKEKADDIKKAMLVE